MGGVAVIKEGWAQVKEGKNFIQPWKQKFLVLRKEALDFHKQEGSKVAYTLFLKDVINVGRVEAAGQQHHRANRHGTVIASVAERA